LSLKLEIESFKSIGKIEMELGHLTILIGPPAAGKSNILDALGLVGYLHRFKLLDREYRNNAGNVEPLILIARYQDIIQLFRYNELSKPVKIRVSGDVALNYEISFTAGALRVLVNDKQLPWDLRVLRSDPMSELQNFAKLLPTFETRLYGFDRFSLISEICATPLLCGLQYRLSSLSQVRDTPLSILSELGWNSPYIVRKHQLVVRDINDVLRERLDERVEVKVRKTGEVIVYDYDYEVEAVGVSESIYRTLYNLLALKSSHYYVKYYGLEMKFVVLLEEPEAHVFPYFLDLIANSIRELISDVYVVVTTHNPLFASLLCDKVKETKLYYTYRCKDGSTCIRELDIDKMAKELVSIEDILFKPPSEVLEKYAIEVAKVEESRASSS